MLCFHAQSQTLNLSTKLYTNQYMVGEKINLILKMEYIPTGFIPESEDSEVITDNQFIYAFSVIPKKAGTLKVGPYSFDFNGKKLTSNTLTLKIQEEKNKNLVRITVPQKASVDQEVVIELYSTKESMLQMKVSQSPNFTVKATSTQSNSYANKDGGYHEYILQKKLVFHKAGVYKIDKSWFGNLPPYLELTEATIVIE